MLAQRLERLEKTIVRIEKMLEHVLPEDALISDSDELKIEPAVPVNPFLDRHPSRQNKQVTSPVAPLPAGPSPPHPEFDPLQDVLGEASRTEQRQVELNGLREEYRAHDQAARETLERIFAAESVPQWHNSEQPEPIDIPSIPPEPRRQPPFRFEPRTVSRDESTEIGLDDPYGLKATEESKLRDTAIDQGHSDTLAMVAESQYQAANEIAEVHHSIMQKLADDTILHATRAHALETSYERQRTA